MKRSERLKRKFVRSAGQVALLSVVFVAACAFAVRAYQEESAPAMCAMGAVAGLALLALAGQWDDAARRRRVWRAEKRWEDGGWMEARNRKFSL